MQLLGCTVVAGGLGFVVGHMRALAFLYDSLGRLPDLAEKVRSATMRNVSITCDTCLPCLVGEHWSWVGSCGRPLRHVRTAAAGAPGRASASGDTAGHVPHLRRRTAAAAGLPLPLSRFSPPIFIFYIL